MPAQVIVPLKGGSDADANHRPVGPTYTQVDPPTLYLEKLGQQWMKARGEARPGVTYILEALPAGYALFQKPRVSRPSYVDKWLYGHPNHKPFDSPNRFFPHFQYLMENEGNSIGCPCTVCNTKGGVLPKGEGSSSSSKRSSSGASSTKSTQSTPPKRKLALAPVPTSFLASAPYQHKGRPKMVLTGMDASRVDEEGTPDVYRNLIDKLKRYGELDEAVMEPMSMDWRAEQSILPELLRSLEEELQWVPRAGDIVLYIGDIPEGFELLQNESTGEHLFWDPDIEDFAGEPTWQAGLVGQTPADSVTTEDAVYQVQKETNVSISGVRVEPLPDPNDGNKALSKRYKYVPVSQTRPFILWKEYLGHIAEKDWHLTIKNALSVMATMSLMGKHRFRGHWPEAQIYCHGIYIGSEMLAVGDTVRLLPKAGEAECTDILVIKSIRLKLLNLDKASTNDYDEGRPYNSECWIFGSAYSTDSSRTSKEWLSAANALTPKSAEGYAKWYPLHPSNKELAVPFSRILGRLFEHDAMNLWLPSNGPRDLDQGRVGLLEAREFARAHDQRITASLDATWFWGDSRAEALDLQTVNGLDVSRYDAERDPRELRKKIKVIEGVGREQNPRPATGAPRDLRVFMAPSAASTLPTRTSIKRELGSFSGNSSTDENSGPGPGRNGHDVIDLSSSDDEDEEIRQHTRVVDDAPSMSQQKKAKVMVFID
ncbi:hypothetical protein K458DRAFT_433906 [Lentithecium fluviatile CBS 122367]|uniref:Cryptic loci regulator 2 N-terminal domain-containing protein n=1 Tax=Lentithecium fluviatile CBS 122367 TaxID=1168545 RepID=A0A6G1IT28_9PLEO|nr:hypothetical protein K458DRAFT_433906 [Lentithecium fluviatile CBS 122367]